MLTVGRFARPARFVPILLVAALFAAAAILLLPGGGGAPDAPRLADARQPTGPPSDAFGVLRDAEDAGLPADARGLLADGGLPTGSPQAVDVGLPRKAWATSSDTTVCLSVPSYAGGTFLAFTTSCAPAADARTGGVANTQYASTEAMDAGGPMALYALVPDGVRTVAVTSPDGAVRRAPVQENAVHVVAKAGDHVAFTDARGAEHALSPSDPEIAGAAGR